MPGGGERSAYMGAERAIIADSPNPEHGVDLHHFNDTVVVKLKLQDDADEGPWLLMGRVLVWNVDGDPQGASVKLVHEQDVVLEELLLELAPRDFPEQCYVVRAGLISSGHDIITLQCSTYNGTARNGSIVAWKVGRIDWQ